MSTHRSPRRSARRGDSTNVCIVSKDKTRRQYGPKSIVRIYVTVSQQRCNIQSIRRTKQKKTASCPHCGEEAPFPSHRHITIHESRINISSPLDRALCTSPHGHILKFTRSPSQTYVAIRPKTDISTGITKGVIPSGCFFLRLALDVDRPVDTGLVVETELELKLELVMVPYEIVDVMDTGTFELGTGMTETLNLVKLCQRPKFEASSYNQVNCSGATIQNITGVISSSKYIRDIFTTRPTQKGTIHNSHSTSEHRKPNPLSIAKFSFAPKKNTAACQEVPTRLCS